VGGAARERVVELERQTRTNTTPRAQRPVRVFAHIRPVRPTADPYPPRRLNMKIKTKVRAGGAVLLADSLLIALGPSAPGVPQSSCAL
jgi:hypothetical protein